MAKKQKSQKTPKTASGEDTPPARGLSRKVKLLAGGALTFALVSVAGGGYLLAKTPTETAEAEHAAPAIPVPMPVASVAPATEAGDYQIVSIFQDEAILATHNNLVRLKVGSTVPGLGTVKQIEVGANGGGAVIGTDATLRSL